MAIVWKELTNPPKIQMVQKEGQRVKSKSLYFNLQLRIFKNNYILMII